jgi:hypothetical protein
MNVRRIATAAAAAAGLSVAGLGASAATTSRGPPFAS